MCIRDRCRLVGRQRFQHLLHRLLLHALGAQLLRNAPFCIIFGLMQPLRQILRKNPVFQISQAAIVLHRLLRRLRGRALLAQAPLQPFGRIGLAGKACRRPLARLKPLGTLLQRLTALPGQRVSLSLIHILPP